MGRRPQPPNVTREELREAYHDREMSTRQVAELFGLSQSKVSRLMAEWGIEARDRQEAQNAGVRHGRHFNPTKGEKRYPDEKELMSASAKTSWERGGRLRRARAKLTRELAGREGVSFQGPPAVAVGKVVCEAVLEGKRAILFSLSGGTRERAEVLVREGWRVALVEGPCGKAHIRRAVDFLLSEEKEFFIVLEEKD